VCGAMPYRPVPHDISRRAAEAAGFYWRPFV
jgi:hypothetical protein